MPYARDKAGMRLEFRGMDTVHPPDGMPPFKYPFAQNCRAYVREGVTSRATQDSTVLTLPAAVHSLRRLNDSTPAGPASGFILVGGAADGLYANAVRVAHGLSGNPISILPFRPNTSPQPWAYVSDSAQSGVVIDSTSYSVPAGMLKVRSDGLTYKMGIKEPQTAPTITSTPAAGVLSLLGPVTCNYWGDSPHSGPVSVYIWRNINDTGSGPVRTAVATPASGVSIGNSLIFDVPPDPSNVTHLPMEWQQYAEYLGTVNTSGTTVTWVGGSQFGGLVAGDKVFIDAVLYTIAAAPAPTNTTFDVTTPLPTATGVSYQTAALSGAIPVFTPQLQADGFSDFNMAIEATLYVPAAGTYTLTATSWNDMMWGIGNTATGQATWAGPSGGESLSSYGQTKTALNGYRLMPRTATNPGGGISISASVAVTFSEAGNYPIEIDYDYWFHTGRTLHIRADGADIPPIPGTVISNAQYRYVYRGPDTGAPSNPSPPSPEQTIAVLANALTATPSTDPQVKKIDWYRLDTGLQNYTYVGTGPNSSAPFIDKLLDTDVAANPILEFDNYEPFPSIDLPRKGTVNVVAGVVQWASGDHFNIRWLPGTIIIVGTVAYTLDKRPTSTTQLTASNVEIVGGFSLVIPIPDGTNLVYEIAEPILAAQPMKHIWGPTDNVQFAFGCGDPIRPGVLYWSKGNNLDSAPDTNQEDVTSPSEPLVNGCITNGFGWVASTERGWLILPNFFNALATVQGTVGSTWTLQESSLKRGLYMEDCLAVDGGGTVYFRAKDGIYASPNGQGGKSITDGDLYNLFPHEGMVPQPITRGGYTVYPPDDTKPEKQTFHCGGGYLYYDYHDASDTPRTLVYDIGAGGWAGVDEYEHVVRMHYIEEGVAVNGVLTGCEDGKVRPLTNTGNENACSVLLTPSETAGDVRATKHWVDEYVEAQPNGT